MPFLQSIQPSTKIIIATVQSFLLGIVVSFNLDNNYAVFLLSICLIIIPSIIHNDQQYKQVSKYTLTTFVFGLIDGWYFSDLEQIQPFKIYLIVMTVYYYGQFQLVNCFHHATLSWNSFLIYHSKHYTLANSAMLVEHLVTRYVFDFRYKVRYSVLLVKYWHFLMVPAFSVMMLGLVLRIIAFFTARRNFTHIIRTQKSRQHQLVTHGVYSLLRHPSYTGFFYFSIASMIFIGNIVCSLGFAVVLQNFFKDRIEYEEYYLFRFFEKYGEYRKRTYVLIPFVKGWEDNHQD